MKITKERLTEIIREELGYQTCQGVDPDTAETGEAVTQLENARIIVARALPELLQQLDYVIDEMKSYGNYPPDETAPYTVYEENGE